MEFQVGTVARAQGPLGQGLMNGAGELEAVAQSRPNPRGGSTRSSSEGSKAQIACSLCASADFPRLIGEVVEPRLVLILKVEQGAYCILPAPGSRAAVLRPAVMQARLLCVAALSITPLSLGVGQIYVHCAPVT